MLYSLGEKLWQNKEKFEITDINKYLQDKWKSGFHVHAPSSSSPKDGPSAGCAFTTAFISRIINKPIDNQVAMTGEIDLLGNITKIGGLEYKINGAKRAGITKILVSKENEDDYKKIMLDDPNLFNGLEIILVETINDVIPHSIIM